LPTDRAGRSPLHYQAFEGPLEDLAGALEGGADPNIADVNGWMPLHFAAQALDPVRVRLLLEHGAEVDPQNRFGVTPVGVALMNAREDDHGVIGLLLGAGADIDIKNIKGISPRLLAGRVSNWDLKKFLGTGD
jgi:ankyrin repeat protein